MLAGLEKDLEGVVKAIEQSIANHNMLLGQKQGLEHVIAKIKTAAQTVENVASATEAVVEAVPESTAS